MKDREFNYVKMCRLRATRCYSDVTPDVTVAAPPYAFFSSGSVEISTKISEDV